MSSEHKLILSAKDKTKKAFKSIKMGLQGVRAGINSTQVKMVALAGVAGLGAVINSSLKYADELGKMSDRLNIATEDLAAFHHMAQLNGESTEGFNKSIEKMTRGIGEAERGLGTAKEGFKDLGINVEALKKLDAKEQFLTIADSINKLDNQTQKASIASDIFGRSGIKLLNSINQGRAGFESARKEVDEYGLSMSRIDAAQAEAANDEILRAGQALKGVGVKISTQLAPYITAATKAFTKMTLEATDGGDWITSAIDGVATAIGWFADGLHGIKILFKGVKLVGISFGAAVTNVFSVMVGSVTTLGQVILDSVLFPLKQLLEIGANFSDTAKGWLAEVNSFQEGSHASAEATKAFFESAANATTDLVRQERGEMEALMMEPLPSEGVKQAFDEVKAAAAAAKKEIEAVATTKVGEITPEEEAKLQHKLERIINANRAELDALQLKHEEELLILQQADENKLISHEEYLKQKDIVEGKYLKKKQEIIDKQNKDEVSAMDALNKHKDAFGKKGAKIAQAAGLKETITNTHTGAMAAYKALAGIPLVGPVLGAAAYAAVMATGLKSQGGIKSGSMGGGASLSGGGGSSPQSAPRDLSQFKSTPSSSESTAQQMQPQIININYKFDNVQGNDGRKLVEEIRSIVASGEEIIPPDSRNAQALAGA